MRWLYCLAAFLILAPWAHAKDVEGSKDHPMFTRLPGYEIASYDAQDFASFDFIGENDNRTVEGRYWRIDYELAEGAKKTGPLQIARNYTNLLVKQGGKKIHEDVDAGGGHSVAQLTSGGRSVWIQLDINNHGEVFTLTVVEEASMEQKVEFTATELAAALRDNGYVALHNVLFDTGKATLQAPSGALLAQVGDLLKRDPALKLEIQGHTDNVGAPAANLKLSGERAAAVRTYLVSNFGIAPTRLSSTGLGDTRPVADNRTDAGRAQNRRVELIRR